MAKPLNPACADVIKDPDLLYAKLREILTGASLNATEVTQTVLGLGSSRRFLMPEYMRVLNTLKGLAKDGVLSTTKRPARGVKGGSTFYTWR